MQPLSGNLRPDLLTHLPHVSPALRLSRDMHLSRSSSNVPRLPSFLKLLQKPACFAHCWQGAKSPAPATQNDIWTSKSAPCPSIFCTFDFWLRNVLRATTACTFSTSQLPKVLWTWCFARFYLEMCFAPQRRALFRHLNFQKWSENGVFCTFWLGNVLRAATACNCSSLIWPAGSAPAALASLLFDPPEPQITGKIHDFPNFSRICIFFLLTLSLLWSFFFSSLLWLFPSLLFICPYCRKFDF